MIDFTDPRTEHLVTHPHFIKGIEHERDRIIALLKFAVIIALLDAVVAEHQETCRCRICAGLSDAIALIKGEN